MTIKNPFQKNKQRTPSVETVKIDTTEELLTFFSFSQQRRKEKRKASSHFDFDISAHGGDDADAGVNADDDAEDGREDESIVRVLESDCWSDS